MDVNPTDLNMFEEDVATAFVFLLLNKQTDNLMDELSVVPSNYRGEIIVALKFIPPPRQQSSSYSSKQSSKRTSNRDTSKLDSASDFSDSDLDMRTTGGIRGKNDKIFCLIFFVQNRC